MRRRDFIILLAGAMAAWPLAARAQQVAMPVIGFLGNTSPALFQSRIVALRNGLNDNGYIDGHNLAIEYRWAEGQYDRLPALAAELVGGKVDLIVTGGTPATRAGKAATSTIPIVFAGVGDPVAAGLVDSLARPGGNVTGFSILATELTPKRLEVLLQLVPTTEIVGLLVNPNNTNTERAIGDAKEVAQAKSVTLHVLTAKTKAEIDAAFASMTDGRTWGLIVQPDGFFIGQRQQLATLALRSKVPTIFGFRDFIEAGGLISYGPSLSAAFRQAGDYAGRVLKGARPSDLPVQQPTTFELIINLKTAREVGLPVPQSLLARADEVIE